MPSHSAALSSVTVRFPSRPRLSLRSPTEPRGKLAACRRVVSTFIRSKKPMAARCRVIRGLFTGCRCSVLLLSQSRVGIKYHYAARLGHALQCYFCVLIGCPASFRSGSIIAFLGWLMFPGPFNPRRTRRSWGEGMNVTLHKVFLQLRYEI